MTMVITTATSRNGDMHTHDMKIDHDENFVVIDFENTQGKVEWVVSMSPAEAKALASGLLHYAERAQETRNREDAK